MTVPQRTAFQGWAIAVSVYVLAVFHRSSLGVAGLRAEQRFDISPGQLSTFVILQLGVYAAMQIPTGVLVDRYGPRRLLIAAAAIMGVAQLLFAISPSYPVALFARAALGCGDALTFVSVLRFAGPRFAPARFPLVVALTGMVGVAGNIVATVPLSLALSHFGWTASFGVAGLISLASGALVWVALPGRDGPAPQRLALGTLGRQMRRVGRRVGASWSHPGTRLGFWLHFACGSAPTTFSALWGYPYLVDGLGFSKAAASTTLLVCVVVSLLGGLVIGAATSRRPTIRVPLAVAICTATVAGWIVMLAIPPASVPPGFAVAVAMVTALGAPGSMVAFALARDYNRPAIAGTASGVVNVGGFSAAIITALGIGTILDATGSSSQDYRVAMIALVGVQAIGGLQMVRWWLRARAAAIVAMTTGEVPPVAVTRHRWDRVVGRAAH